jgi:hypothetical protein
MVTTPESGKNLSHREDSQSHSSLRIPDGLTPFVRYATTSDDGSPDQFHRLHRLREPIPTDADFVSPVYLLTDQQVESHDELLTQDDLFRVRDYKSIAIKLQTECEDDGRVRYPVFIESDADVPYYEMRAGLKRFIREVLDVDPDDAKWFFSGGSSLHVHLPYFVANEDGLERLRREAQQYNEDADVAVDASNFTKKSLVRLPGAEHHDTGVTKTNVSPTSSDKKLQKRIAQLVGGIAPEKQGVSYQAETLEITRYSLSNELSLTKEVPTPVIEQQNKPVGNVELWKRYNRHPFSPYANTGNQRRSVVVAKVKGTPFCRKTTINGREKWRIYVPTYIYGSVGADGEYKIWCENAPIQLSRPDYKKWEYEEGDTIVLIGGNSASSVIHEVDEWLAEAVHGSLVQELHGEDTESNSGRKDAIEYLEQMGYDVGSAGKNGPRRDNSQINSTNSTDGYQLQRQAEKGDVEQLEHDERLTVGDRLLKTRGWDGAVEWFKEQYGNRYDPEITRNHLSSTVERYDDVSPPE